MNNEKLEALKEKYAVKDEELKRLAEIIFNKLTFGKTPAKHPVAIIVGGQPGAGKSGLIDKSLAEMENSVILDLDDFRYFHPQINEILKKYPNDLATFTIKFVNDVFFKYVFEKVINEGYNIISQKTFRDDDIIEDTLKLLYERKYTVIIRVLAVHELESKLSTVERSLAVKRTVGFCRWTPLKNQDYAYNGVPTTVNHMFKSKYSDVVQVYTRNNIPVNSNLVYSKVKASSNKKVSTILNENPNLSLINFGQENYKDEVEAILKNREKDALLNIKDIMLRIILLKQNIDEEGKKYLDELEVLASKKFLRQNDIVEYMNNNIMLELSKEVMARKIADACRNGIDENDEETMNLLSEEAEMNKFNSHVIDKIINKYGSEIKNGK